MGRRGMQAARSLRDLWRASRPMTREKAHAAMGKWQWRSASFPIERLEDVSESLLAVAATLQVTTITFDPDTANGEVSCAGRRKPRRWATRVAHAARVAVVAARLAAAATPLAPRARARRH